MSGPVLPRQRATTMTSLLTWAFKDQCAHLNLASALDDFSPDWRGESGDGVAFLMRTGGVIVDGGGGGGGSGMPPDALELSILCEKLLSRDEWLMVLWAALAERPPEWGAKVPAIRCAPVFRAHPLYGNQVKIITLGPGRGKRGYRGIKLCPVQYLDQEAERDRLRRQYSKWFLAILRLLHECQDRPERFQKWYVESPGAPAEPWANGALREIA